MWLNQLKIAIIENNINNLDKLLDDIPTLSDAAEIEEAIYLLREASELVYTLQDKTKSSMTQIKKNIDFLNSATANQTSKFDIIS